MEPETRTCCRCAEVKPLTEYYKLKAACRVCILARQREISANRSPEQIAKERATRIKYREAHRAQASEWAKKYAASERGGAIRAAWVADNSASRAVTMQKSRAKRAEQNRIYAMTYRAENPEFCARTKVRIKADRDELRDSYVRSILRFGTTLNAKDIPQSLVEVKRLQLQISRTIKNGKC